MKMRRQILLVLLSAVFLAAALWIGGAGQVFRELHKFVLEDLIWMGGLLGLNLFITILRLRRILTHFGILLPLRVAAKASISGHVASLFFISLFGQVFGRHLVLRKFGVRPVVIASLFAYERIVLFIIGTVLGIAGAIWLLDGHVILDFLNSVPLLEVALATGGGVALSLILNRSRFEVSVLSNAFSVSNVRNFLEVVLVTLIAQSVVLGGFVIGILALNPGVDFLDALAASALISFAASMPLSVNGWGVRELAAVYVLGQLGVESSSAVAISIVVGLCATAVVVVASPLTLGARDQRLEESRLNSVATRLIAVDIEKAATLLLVMISSALIFFQLHFTFPQGAINLNLADPLAILALTVVVIHVLSERELPGWKTDKFNIFVLLFSIVLLFSFSQGVTAIGITQWAVGNRLVGWLVLLGYLSLGYLAIVYLNARGRRRLYTTVISTAVVIVIIQILLRWADYSELISSLDITKNFEGYSANRNAFAFQLLVCSMLVMAHSKINILTASASGSTSGVRKVVNVERISALLLGILIAGIVLTGSRAGIITSIILFLFNWLLKWMDRRVILWSIGCAFLVWGSAHILWFLPHIQFGGQNDVFGTGITYITFHSRLSGQMSNIERWDSIIQGVRMWLDSPITGSGLGVFIERSDEWSDHPVVIHSTPIWILAELGLVGLGVCLWGLMALLRPIYTRRARRISDRIIVMLTVVFVVFGLVHEIFYQRIFWMVLGAALAYPALSKKWSKPATRSAI